MQAYSLWLISINFTKWIIVRINSKKGFPDNVLFIVVLSVSITYWRNKAIDLSVIFMSYIKYDMNIAVVA